MFIRDVLVSISAASVSFFCFFVCPDRDSDRVVYLYRDLIPESSKIGKGRENKIEKANKGHGR